MHPRTPSKETVCVTTDQTDLLDVYDRASGWTAVKVKGATRQLDRETPCDEWGATSDLLRIGTLRLSAFAVPVITATVPVRTGITNRAMCSVVVEAISPITTGPTT